MMRRLLFELRYLLGSAPWDSGVSPPELTAFLDTHPAGRALDLGCGTGTNVITIAKRGWEVLGVDFSAAAIRKAVRKVRAADVRASLFQGDVTALDDGAGRFDLALDIGCFHSLPLEARDQYALSLACHVRPGGTFLFYTFLSEPAEKGSWPTADAINRWFGGAFEITSVSHGEDRGRRSAWFTMRRRVG